MKKIPTLFKREFDKHKVINISSELMDTSLIWVINGEGIATEKIDGSCCAVIGGVFYKHYDAKRGKKPPVGAIPCDEPDPITGHWPHWVKVDESDSGDKSSRRFSYLRYPKYGREFVSEETKQFLDMLDKYGLEIIDITDDLNGGATSRPREILKWLIKCDDHKINAVGSICILDDDGGFAWGY